MSRGNILKISSFCSPKKGYQQRHSSHKQAVSISVLHSKVQRRNGEEYDDYSTVFTNDIDLFFSLQVFDGAICKLSNNCSYCPQNVGSPIIVHLRMLPESDKYCSTSIQAELPQLFIPILTAVSIGIHDSFHHELNHTAIIEKLTDDECHHLRATSIKVTEICSPPSDFLPCLRSIFAYQNLSLRQSLDKERETFTLSNLKNYFLQPENKFGRLLTKGSIIATLDDDPLVSVRFYKILSIGVDNDLNKLFAWVTPGTDIILLSNSLESACSIPRFPNRDSVNSFMMGNKIDIPLDVRSSHPELVTALLGIGTVKVPLDSSTLPNMIHVIRDGNTIEFNSILDDAAKTVAFNIFHIDGLAALSLRFKRKNNILESTSGSIRDKMHGIQCAFDIAIKSNPCIVHLQVDREISAVHDDEQRQDEEQRLIAAITSEYKRIRIRSNTTSSYKPVIIMMISSSRDLPVGPISSSLLYESVSITCSKSDKKDRYSHLIPNVKWDDIGGLSHVRKEIMDTIELPLKHPKLFMNSRRSGILLYGPPGSGKTLVAKAVASECGLPFLNVKGPELLGSYVGESESNIRNIFESAREAAQRSRTDKNAPGTCILFFDEIDSLAPNRGDLGDNGGVMDRVVSTLLGEIDNTTIFDRSKNQLTNIIVVGATNRPDLLDPSLLRPGRFDRLVYLGLAESRADRIGILAAQTRKFQFEDGIDSYAMASRVIDQIPLSLSGADFSAIASGALMIAMERICDDIDNAISLLDHHCSVEEYLESNKDFDTTPRVKASDIINAAAKVIPSVTEKELQRYELLRNEYSMRVD